MYVVEEITARGHPNIRATHKSTFEVTKDAKLTRRGDCIIGVMASKAASELSQEMKNMLSGGSWLIVVLYAPGIGTYDYVIARGSPRLTLSDHRSIVVRKSEYVDGRTIAIGATKAARDIKREIAEYMRSPNSLLRVVLVATFHPERLTEKLPELINLKSGAYGGPGGT